MQFHRLHLHEGVYHEATRLQSHIVLAWYNAFLGGKLIFAQWHLVSFRCIADLFVQKCNMLQKSQKCHLISHRDLTTVLFCFSQEQVGFQDQDFLRLTLRWKNRLLNLIVQNHSGAKRAPCTMVSRVPLNYRIKQSSLVRSTSKESKRGTRHILVCVDPAGN